jgi:AcrR family transcriptional regulator
MIESSVRDRKASQTRARIAKAALELFLSRGYAETTVDQIADTAGVSRRTVFHHFPAKGAMLLEHLVGRREVAIQRLQARPASEPPLVSLHTVLRELCQQDYDRRFLAQIRAVLEAEPQLAGTQLSLGIGAFEKRVIATLENRAGKERSSVEIRAVTFMAIGWFISAVQVYLIEGRPSLVECFDEAVASCLRWNPGDLARSAADA